MPACAVCGYQAAEAFKFCPECGTAAVTRTSEQRKVVTVLFCDVVGSTALGESTDAEVVRMVLARYFERMQAIVDSHGGTVEKFIGDAVMEAEPLLRRAQAVPAGPVERALAPCVEALILTAQGEPKEAEALARVGIAAAETETDNLWLQWWGYEDLATVLEGAGRIDEAGEALERALAL